MLHAVLGPVMSTTGFVSLVSSFTKCLVSSYYMPGTVPGTWDLGINQMKSLPSWNYIPVVGMKPQHVNNHVTCQDMGSI